MDQTIITIITGLVIAIGAFIWGRNSNRQGMGGVKSDIGRAKQEARTARDGIRVSKDTVGRILESNKESQSLVGRARKILARARARAKRKDNTLDGG